MKRPQDSKEQFGVSALPIRRALNIATDLTGALITDVDFSLYDLFAASSRAGQPLVSGRTFRGCRIQGPGIVLASTGVTFTDVNFGDSRGRMANLLFQGLGDKAIGATPIRDCAFISCEFYDVGFTGPESFLEQMLKVSGTPGVASGSGA